MSRVLVKARVSGLDSIPWFFTFNEGLDPTSDSQTVQCEIFQATLIGGLPQDKDFQHGPDDDDFQPHQFAYFGFGQPGHGPPVPPPPLPLFNPFVAPEPNQQIQQALGWEIWPNQDNAIADNA